MLYYHHKDVFQLKLNVKKPKNIHLIMNKNKLSLEILLNNEVYQLLDSFAAILKTQIVFYSNNGTILKRGRNLACSKYCSLVQERYFSVDQCLQLDKKMQKQSQESNLICSYQCHAHLTEIVAPVVILESIAGFIVIGQFRTTNTIPDFAKNDPELCASFMELPYFSTAEIENLKDMIKTLIDYIVNKELISFTDSVKYRKIVNFLRSNIRNNPTIKEVANHLNISISSLAHFLHDQYGTSLKKLEREIRIKLAEDFMKNNPNSNINEVATFIGINDSHYFSRIYRQERGYPPSKFLQNL
jgi:AraC-like DNA-binding protein